MTPEKKQTVVSLLLGLGLIGIGAAMAWSVALALLQDAAIAAGQLPQPGALIQSDAYKASPLWGAATTLQDLANTAGVLGGASLIAVALLSRDDVDLDLGVFDS